MSAASVLCRNELERSRLLDMSERLRPAGRWSLLLLAVAAIASIPVYGLATQIPFAAAGVAWLLAQWRAPRLRRPELTFGAVWLFAQAAIVAAIAITSGQRIYMLSLLVFPMLVTAPVFPRRVVATGAVITGGVIIGTGFAFMPHAVEATPPVIVFPLLLLATLTLLGSRTLAAEEDSRHAVVVDPLTGLLNRSALQARAAELTYYMAGGEAADAAVIVGDVDRFKAINDDHGHACGDAVLVEVARRLERVVAQNGSLYRFGGEEFVVLLEGADASSAAELAERMRTAVRREPIAGMTITMSFGTARSSVATRDYPLLFANADQALYRSKASGRDRVCCDESAGRGVASGYREPADGDPRRDRRTSRGPRPTASRARGVSRAGPQDADVPRNFIIRSAAERQHLLDLSGRTREIAKTVNPLTLAVLVSAVPWLGWLALVPVVISVAALQVLQVTVVARSARPEYPRILAVFLVIGGTAAGLIIAKQPLLFALPFLTILMFSSAAAFPAPAAAGMAVATGVIMAVVAFAIGAHEVLHNPSILTLPLALLGAVSCFGNAVGAVTVDQLSAATTDQLTGVLNRTALRSRSAELTQGDVGRQPAVAMLMIDLDHFKTINDERGHAVGDRVLIEVAERIRAGLRLFDPLYRIGGEEFVALVVGVDEDVVTVAERVRQAVRRKPIQGLTVTVSVGVAVCRAGEVFEYEPLFGAADAALRVAKGAGRDRVCGVGVGGVGEAVAA